MEKLKKLFLGLLIVSSFCTSCKKDNEVVEDISQNDVIEDTSKNYFKVGDTEYLLSKGVLENSGLGNEYFQHDGYNIDLWLFSDGISFDTSPDGCYHDSGSGQLILFEMFSSQGDELDSGDYTFSSSEPYPVGTFDWGGIIYDFAADDDIENEFTSGNVTISKNGDEYSISFNCTLDNGETVTGYYKGSLKYFDCSGD